MRSLLEIAQEACERDNTAPPPQDFTNAAQDKLKRILLTAISDTVREVLRKSEYQGLSDFHSQWAFATASGRYVYPLPPDFLRPIPRAAVREGYPMGLLGPVSPATWVHWIEGVSAGACQTSWRILNGHLVLTPTPTSAELVVMEYLSRWPYVRDVIPADLDTGGTPTLISDSLQPIVARSGLLDASVRNLSTPPTFDHLKIPDPEGTDVTPQVRFRQESVAGADPGVIHLAMTDVHPVSLGVTYRLRRGLGLPYHEHAADYEEELAVKLATDGGARSFTIGESDEPPRAWPLGGDKWMIG